jgi:hypothetical protein
VERQEVLDEVGLDPAVIEAAIEEVTGAVDEDDEDLAEEVRSQRRKNGSPSRNWVGL